MRIRHDTDALKVSQLRADPMIARALDLAVNEADRAGIGAAVPRDGGSTLLQLLDWVEFKYRRPGSREQGNLAFCAALYRLLALLGGNVTDLWVGGEQEAVERTVRESLLPLLEKTSADTSHPLQIAPLGGAPDAPKCGCLDENAVLCAFSLAQRRGVGARQSAALSVGARCLCSCHGAKAGAE